MYLRGGGLQSACLVGIGLKCSGQRVLCTAKKRGKEVRSFSTVRGAVQNGDSRVEANFMIMRLTRLSRVTKFVFCITRLLGVHMSTKGEDEPCTGQKLQPLRKPHSASVWGRNWSPQARSVLRVQSLTLSCQGITETTTRYWSAVKKKKKKGEAIKGTEQSAYEQTTIRSKVRRLPPRNRCMWAKKKYTESCRWPPQSARFSVRKRKCGALE